MVRDLGFGIGFRVRVRVYSYELRGTVRVGGDDDDDAMLMCTQQLFVKPAQSATRPRFT